MLFIVSKISVLKDESRALEVQHYNNTILLTLKILRNEFHGMWFFAMIKEKVHNRNLW